MSTLRFIGSVLLAALAAPGQTAAQTPLRAEIEPLVRAYVQAHNRADAAGIAQFYSTQPGVTSVGDGEIVRGWDRIREHVDQLDRLAALGGRLNLTTGSLDVVPLGDSYALALTSYTASVQMEQGSLEERGAMTLVLQKIAGSWKIIHDHTSTRREDVTRAQGEIGAAGAARAEPTSISIAAGRASEVPAAGYLQYAFQLPPGACRITGRIEGISGGNKDFRALIVDADNFRNWSARLEAQAWWQSGQVTVTNIDAQIAGPGTFHLVIDNTFSVSTAKTVQAWADARC